MFRDTKTSAFQRADIQESTSYAILGSERGAQILFFIGLLGPVSPDTSERTDNGRGAKRRKFSAEFKREAVQMAMSDTTLRHVAKDLGISEGVLGKWKRDLARHGEQAFIGEAMLAMKS